MKLSFTTAGCPGWSFNEIFATAKDLGMDGVEIRGVGDRIYAPDIAVFSDENLPATVRRFAEAKMEISALDSDAALALADTDRPCVEEAKAYIDLASRLGCRYVRVMGTRRAAPEQGDLDGCLERYRLLCRYGADKGVTPLMETNGMFADTKLLKSFLDSAGENCGALWDIHHPFRFFGESPRQTAENIGKYVRHTHIKDSVMSGGAPIYKMLGYGDLPIEAAVEELEKLGYEGYISLEWLKRWNPELTEPGIVFAHFASYMGYLREQ